VLSRSAAGLLGLGAVLSPAFALLPIALARLAAVPVGVGLAWLVYATWSERRENVSQPLPRTSSQPTKVAMTDALGVLSTDP
jgi:hypothetical protein